MGQNTDKNFSSKGRATFNKWFNSFDDSTGMLDSLSAAEREAHRKRLLSKTKSELGLDQKRDPSSRRPILYHLLHSPISKVAAILTIGLLLSVFAYHLSDDLNFSVPEQVAMIQQKTKVGELSKITLPDGTTVWLGAASMLMYPEEFTGSQRRVELDGEAYFEVAHNDVLPFVATSGPVKTRVLGTKFNIKAYKKDQEVAVTLASGKVEITSGGTAKPIILSPDEQLRYNKKSGIEEVKSINASMVNAWKDKELVFLRESFAEIAKTFERWYGVEFLFEDPALKEEVFVYHFKEFSLEHSMEILSKLADFSYEIKNKKVIVSKK